MSEAGYHTVKVICKAKAKRPDYIAGFTNAQRKHGFVCSKCGATSPYAGDKYHIITKARGAV